MSEKIHGDTGRSAGVMNNGRTNCNNQNTKSDSNRKATIEILRLVDSLTESKEKTLFSAIANEDVNVIKQLLKSDVNIKKKTLFGLNPLHIAAKIGNTQVVDLFLSEGIDINLLTNDRRSALHIAVEEQHVHIAKQLLENGIKINTQNLHCNSPLHEATQRVNIVLVKLLLDNGADPNLMNEKKMSAFLLSFQQRNEQLVKLFLEYDVDIRLKNDLEMTALHFAAQFKYPDIVKRLLNMKLDPNDVTCSGLTPLHYAMERHSFIKYFIKEMNGQYSIDNADQLVIIRYLVEHGSDVNREDERGRTPLHLAIEKRYSKDIIQYLVEVGAEVDHTTNEGSTPLLAALEADDTYVIHCLLEHGAKVQGKNSKGDPLLHIAIKSTTSYIENVRMLIKYGALVDERNAEGLTALHLVSGKHKELLELLINSGANIHAKDCNNQSVLQIAVNSNDSEMVSRLLAKGASYANDFDWNCTRRPYDDKMERALLRHAALLVARNEDNAHLIPKQKELRNIFDEYYEELTSMKKTLVAKEADVSYFDLLSMPRSKLIGCLRHESVRRGIASHAHRDLFVLYLDEMEEICQIGTTRLHLIDIVQKSLYTVFQNELPFEIVGKVVQAFSINDLYDYIDTANLDL